MGDDAAANKEACGVVGNGAVCRYHAHKAGHREDSCAQKEASRFACATFKGQGARCDAKPQCAVSSEQKFVGAPDRQAARGAGGVLCFDSTREPSPAHPSSRSRFVGLPP